MPRQLNSRMVILLQRSKNTRQGEYGGRTASAPVPKVVLASLVSDNDYPSEALGSNEQGTVLVRLDIDEAGKPSGCRIAQSSGSASLDRQTCAIFVRRGRFDPAIDAAGKPVASHYVTRLTWRMW